MICKNCGKNIPESAKKCPDCGSAVNTGRGGNGFFDILSPEVMNSAPASSSGGGGMNEQRIMGEIAKRDEFLSGKMRTMNMMTIIALIACGVLLCLSLVLFVNQGSTAIQAETNATELASVEKKLENNEAQVQTISDQINNDEGTIPDVPTVDYPKYDPEMIYDVAYYKAGGIKKETNKNNEIMVNMNLDDEETMKNFIDENSKIKEFKGKDNVTVTVADGSELKAPPEKRNGYIFLGYRIDRAKINTPETYTAMWAVDELGGENGDTVPDEFQAAIKIYTLNNYTFELEEAKSEASSLFGNSKNKGESTNETVNLENITPATSTEKDVPVPVYKATQNDEYTGIVEAYTLKDSKDETKYSNEGTYTIEIELDSLHYDVDEDGKPEVKAVGWKVNETEITLKNEKYSFPVVAGETYEVKPIYKPTADYKVEVYVINPDGKAVKAEEQCKEYRGVINENVSVNNHVSDDFKTSHILNKDYKDLENENNVSVPNGTVKKNTVVYVGDECKLENGMPVYSKDGILVIRGFYEIDNVGNIVNGEDKGDGKADRKQMKIEFHIVTDDEKNPRVEEIYFDIEETGEGDNKQLCVKINKLPKLEVVEGYTFEYDEALWKYDIDGTINTLDKAKENEISKNPISINKDSKVKFVFKYKKDEPTVQESEEIVDQNGTADSVQKEE